MRLSLALVALLSLSSTALANAAPSLLTDDAALALEKRTFGLLGAELGGGLGLGFGAGAGASAASGGCACEGSSAGSSSGTGQGAASSSSGSEGAHGSSSAEHHKASSSSGGASSGKGVGSAHGAHSSSSGHKSSSSAKHTSTVASKPHKSGSSTSGGHGSSKGGATPSTTHTGSSGAHKSGSSSSTPKATPHKSGAAAASQSAISSSSSKGSSSHSSGGKGSASASGSLKGQAGIEASLKTCTSTVRSLGVEIETALASCNTRSASAVVAACADIFVEMHLAIKVAAHACVSIAGQGGLSLEVAVVAKLLAGLLNAFFAALLPLYALVAHAPGLVLLLAAHLLPIIFTLASLCHVLFAVSGGLIAAVVALLDAKFAVVLKTMGCGSLLSVLGLL
ncbi:hypothetical protein JCM8208_000569 [Rhodotorula glutinis]